MLGAVQQDNAGVFPAGLAVECGARQVQQGWHPARPGFPVAGWRGWGCLLLQLFLMPSSGFLVGVWNVVFHQDHLPPSPFSQNHEVLPRSDKEMKSLAKRQPEEKNGLNIIIIFLVIVFKCRGFMLAVFHIFSCSFPTSRVWRMSWGVGGGHSGISGGGAAAAELFAVSP